MNISSDLWHLVAVLVPLIHLGGVFFALDAIWQSRTSQGAAAWATALVSFPYLSIPLYLVFGRTRFHGYVRARRSHDANLKALAQRLAIPKTEAELPTFRVLENLARMPFTAGNDAELLIDGEATFAAIFNEIEKAQSYVLVQFFIARDDQLGQELARRLKAKAATGVKCFYLYDEVGSHQTKRKYWQDLRAHGVEAAPFNTRRGGWRNRFQINFRNHRKIVVVDGVTAFVGGHNVGDDYLGAGPLGRWRDTHVRVTGPVVQATQLSFVEDWHWATDRVLELHWQAPDAKNSGANALALPTGPSDETDAASLMFCQLLQSARKRIWLSSPYFVPDTAIISQLKLAALRGVEVKILLPAKPDHYLAYWASFGYIEEVETAGVEFYRFAPGFPHQKVVLVDDAGASIGTANLDNRSLNLNFEITLLLAGPSIVKDTERMLANDFRRAERVPPGLLKTRKPAFRLLVRIARLFSPIL